MTQRQAIATLQKKYKKHDINVDVSLWSFKGKLEKPSYSVYVVKWGTNISYSATGISWEDAFLKLAVEIKGGK